jgi:hypothetical protein
MFRDLVRVTLALTFTSLVATATAQAQSAADDQLPANYMLSSKSIAMTGNSIAAGGVLGHKSTGGVLGIDSLTNWSSYFYVPDNAGGFQFTWPYTMVGNSPFTHGDGDNDDDDDLTTWIPSPIVPVTVQLLDTNGSVRIIGGQPAIISSTQLVNPVLRSPAFSPSTYTSSSSPTQFTDAVQRAEFFRSADRDWHTLLTPRVLPARTMSIPRGKYAFAPKSDGTCCRFVLVDADTFVNLLFPPTPTDTTTVMGAVENAHQISTADLSIFLFNNIYLFQGTPANCCIIGFHSYDVEPGSAANGFREKRYVMSYASWISPGVFSDPTFGDISALSHELSETFNDPFVNNITPWWLAPNGNCQNDLETGDVIEGLPNAQTPITTNGFTYHPQNEALVQWFADQSPSTAISHAFSYPDTTVLTSPNTPQFPGCTPPR